VPQAQKKRKRKKEKKKIQYPVRCQKYPRQDAKKSGLTA
jgi:hypothetical protein